MNYAEDVSEICTYKAKATGRGRAGIVDGILHILKWLHKYCASCVEGER